MAELPPACTTRVKTLRGNRGGDHDRYPDDPAAVYMPARVQDRESAQRWLESTGKGRE